MMTKSAWQTYDHDCSQIFILTSQVCPGQSCGIPTSTKPVQCRATAHCLVRNGTDSNPVSSGLSCYFLVFFAGGSLVSSSSSASSSSPSSSSSLPSSSSSSASSSSSSSSAVAISFHFFAGKGSVARFPAGSLLLFCLKYARAFIKPSAVPLGPNLSTMTSKSSSNSSSKLSLMPRKSTGTMTSLSETPSGLVK